jgi:DNA gyrase/topoisomerase IV subunit B
MHQTSTKNRFGINHSVSRAKIDNLGSDNVYLFKGLVKRMANNNTIKKLSDYAHARLRTEMYLGSRALHTQAVLEFVDGKPVPVETSWVPALYTAFREVLDNALDEVVGHGFGGRIDVTYDEKTREISIADDGRGIPIGWDEEHKCHLATLVMTEARAGRNFDERGEVAGTNGIGASVVNFCSEYFKLDIQKDGERFQQEFRQGDVVNGEELVVTKPKIAKRAGKNGTKVTFRLSDKVFPDLTLPELFIRSRVTEVAICNPLIKVFYNGDQVKVKPRPEQSLFPGLKPMSIEIKEDSFRSRFWIVPKWTDGSEHVHTIVNNIPAFNGGVHIDTFRRYFYGNLLTALEKESKRRKLQPNRSDVMEGILIYNITNMHGPNFDSQSKTRLINEEVGKIIRVTLDNPEFYKEFIKKNREWIEEIYQRCAERTLKKDAGDLAKAAKKNLRNKVPRLMDATGSDRTKCILFLAEGESAISGMGSVRNPDLHGGLGMKGKVLNVNGESPKKVIENKELADIMNCLGLVIGQKANRKDLRYGKVYLATDMDPDGANIAALLTNFFYTYWPELFDAKQDPFIYVFQTPFIIAEKGKTRKYWYAHDYHDFKGEDYVGWAITRAKGLGTLTRDDWQYSLDNPVAIPLTDDGKLLDALDLIFNSKKTDERKQWIGL